METLRPATADRAAPICALPIGPVPEGFVPLRLVLVPSGYAVQLTRVDCLIGRHSDADVRLPLPDVSRHHCRFLWVDGQWQVTDLGSLNGTFVNDQPVRQATLRADDRVRIGGFTFRVELAEAVHDSDAALVRRIFPAQTEAPQRKAS